MDTLDGLVKSAPKPFSNCAKVMVNEYGLPLLGLLIWPPLTVAPVSVALPTGPKKITVEPFARAFRSFETVVPTAALNAERLV